MNWVWDIVIIRVILSKHAKNFKNKNIVVCFEWFDCFQRSISDNNADAIIEVILYLNNLTFSCVAVMEYYQFIHVISYKFRYY